MKNLHIILQRTIVTFFVICFVIVSTYIPQSWDEVKQARAGGGGFGGATEITQIANNIELLGVNAATTASAGFDAITSGSTASLWLKENLLDGIGWMLAKQIISQMTASIVKWINSGFKGSPAFVQDLQGFLMKAGDEAFGKYLEELGGPLSSLCSPFKLDIRIALSSSYLNNREVKKPTCTLSGALANMEDFIDGSFDEGGWDAWFAITSNPTTYTGLGSLLQTEIDGSIRIVNAKGEQTKILDFGSGFLSSKICEKVQGSSVDNCFISTPGKVINEALTFQLSTGPASLVEADEINEIIGALLSQITQQAITGASGLLGLSGGTGYTAPGYAGGSLVDELSSTAATQTISPAKLGEEINASLATELRYRDLANTYSVILNNFAGNILNNSDRRDRAQDQADAMPALLITINSNIAALNAILVKYNALPINDTPEVAIQRSQLTQEYLSLRNLHTPIQVTGAETMWEALVR